MENEIRVDEDRAIDVEKIIADLKEKGLLVDDIKKAISLGDAKYMQKFPGIGPKAAQQIILDLKGKLISDEQANKPSAKKSDKYSDVYDALRQFGYKVTEIDNAINKVENIENLQTVTIIKECLKLLRK